MAERSDFPKAIIIRLLKGGSVIGVVRVSSILQYTTYKVAFGKKVMVLAEGNEKEDI